ncbi:hypothetical protein CERZMDRAFT_50719 [Cercospora zeae-maydis SCOH1-5]|uniref:Heterokaryon incompatibility domain-containing protein n=1 Tax=Cercospora zeae-maydis SCOH1-5 TaxID=717836 RepID=A0A6A6F118_9PEZI|nr:hypothetical protein CERZMDRAFT_50719 [Cercospora zeae-maydis SCOH1-5]
MWLLHARTRQLKHFVDDWRMSTSYAILSHTWGKNEVSFDDFHQDDAKTRDGYRKIEYTCAQALKDGIEYVWVDTCCIDKRSSADLSEAINSMYRWYYNAQVCYAYLEDVWTPPESRRSLWFTRGWTLQELIAPETVRFFEVPKQHLVPGIARGTCAC